MLYEVECADDIDFEEAQALVADYLSHHGSALEEGDIIVVDWDEDGDLYVGVERTLH